MKKKKKKIVSIVLAIVVLITCYPCKTEAAETVEDYEMERIYTFSDSEDSYIDWTTIHGNDNSKSTTPTLTSCSISRRYSSQGLHMEFYTYCSHTSEEVGVKDVKIQKKVGIFWSTVATSDGGSCADNYAYGGSLLYSNAEYGETYRVSCVHFAYCGGYDLQAENVTEGQPFTY